MMAARIPFLEQLAPANLKQSAVRPVLPSRFAPASAEGLPGELTAAVVTDPPPEISGDRLAGRSERQFGQGSADAPRPAGAAHSPLQAPAITGLPAPPSRPELAAVGPIPRAASAEAMARRGPVVLPSGKRGEETPSFNRPVERRVTKAADLRLTAEPVAPPAYLVDPQAPLREIVVRHRAATETSRAPAEIHVTIDRIDVRAPAAAAAEPAGPASRARRAPSLSLVDYLREREQARGSGGAR
jgi:hypothetical protein